MEEGICLRELDEQKIAFKDPKVFGHYSSDKTICSAFNELAGVE